MSKALLWSLIGSVVLFVFAATKLMKDSCDFARETHNEKVLAELPCRVL